MPNHLKTVQSSAPQIVINSLAFLHFHHICLIVVLNFRFAGKSYITSCHNLGFANFQEINNSIRKFINFQLTTISWTNDWHFDVANCYLLNKLERCVNIYLCMSGCVCVCLCVCWRRRLLNATALITFTLQFKCKHVVVGRIYLSVYVWLRVHACI